MPRSFAIPRALATPTRIRSKPNDFNEMGCTWRGDSRPICPSADLRCAELNSTSKNPGGSHPTPQLLPRLPRLADPSLSSRSSFASSPPGPRFAPHPTVLRTPPARSPTPPAPGERNAAASWPPTESLPADWLRPCPRYREPIRAPAHTNQRARQCSPTPTNRAIPPHLRPGPTKYRQTCSRSERHRDPSGAVPAASQRNLRTDVPASPPDNLFQYASPHRATAASTRARSPYRPRELSSSASSPEQMPREQSAPLHAPRSAWC